MTEEEWVRGGPPYALIHGLPNRPLKRKLRLFGVACCARVAQLLVDEHSRLALALAEQFADGNAQQKEIRAAAQTLMDRVQAQQFDAQFAGQSDLLAALRAAFYATALSKHVRDFACATASYAESAG